MRHLMGVGGDGQHNGVINACFRHGCPQSADSAVGKRMGMGRALQFVDRPRGDFIRKGVSVDVNDHEKAPSCFPTVRSIHCLNLTDRIDMNRVHGGGKVLRGVTAFQRVVHGVKQLHAAF